MEREANGALTLQRIERALSGAAAGGTLLGRLPGMRRAAVALLLRPVAGDVEVLLIRRSEREDDPWSGQMALPGGRLEPEDAGCVRRAAARESREEVGIDPLRAARWLGALPEQQAIGRGVRLPLVIAPQVFALAGPPYPAPRPDPREVAEALWVPLGALRSGRYDDVHRWRVPALGTHLELPCWRYEGRVIWGLTHRMLRSLLERL